MVEIQFEDPPAVAIARVKTPGQYVEWAYALREYPGKWAVLPEGRDGKRSVKGADNLAQSIRRGTTAGFKPKGTYDAVADEVKDDPDHPEPYGKVWVKYLGEPQPPKDDHGDDHGEDEGDRPQVTIRTGSADEDDGPLPVQQTQARRRGDDDPSEIRQWARDQGWTVPNRGRLPGEIIEAYYKAKTRPRHIVSVPNVSDG